MKPTHPLDLGRRERQIMEAVYARSEASVSQVREALDDPPTYSAVRAVLNVLVEKGRLRRKKSGKRFLYLPTVHRDKARRTALRSLIATFFNGSAAEAAASLLEMADERLSGEELDRLSALIDEAPKEGR